MIDDDRVELWAEAVPAEFQDEYGRYTIWLGDSQRRAIVAGANDLPTCQTVAEILGPRAVILIQVWETLGASAMMAAVHSALAAPDASLN